MQSYQMIFYLKKKEKEKEKENIILKSSFVTLSTKSKNREDDTKALRALKETTRFYKSQFFFKKSSILYLSILA